MNRPVRSVLRASVARGLTRTNASCARRCLDATLTVSFAPGCTFVVFGHVTFASAGAASTSATTNRERAPGDQAMTSKVGSVKPV